MARSRRKTTGPGKGAAGGRAGAAKAPETPSAAFATAHEFVDRPAAGSGTKGTASRSKASASAPAASAAESVRAGTATAQADSTERASGATSQEAAEAAERSVSAQEEPVPGAAEAVAGAPAGAAADSAPARAAAAGEHTGAGAGEHHETLHGEHEHERIGAAAIALMVVAGVIAVAVLTLWLAPRAAPHLPGGLARYLTPGQVAVEDRIEELESRVAESEAAAEQLMSSQPDLQAQVQELQSRVATLGEEQGPGTDAEARSGLEAAAGERRALSARIAALEDAMSGIRSEIDAVNRSLAEGQGSEGPTNPELATALAQLRSRVESLAGTVEGARSGFADEVAALSQRLDEALARADEAETARAEAEAEAERAAAAAALNEALARLDSRFQLGEPYAEALGEVESLTGSTAPDALAGAAETGVTTTSALAERLSRVARAALVAAPPGEAADDPVERVVDWFRAQIAIRPADETAGDSVGAILSRVEARLEEGEPSAALAEAGSLPEPSRAAIEPWLEALAARAAAGAALDEWRTGLAASG